jgi:O-antigen ligase
MGIKKRLPNVFCLRTIAAMILLGVFALGGLGGWLGFFVSISVLVGLVFFLIMILRLDALVVTLIAGLHLYIDWYLGLHLVAPFLAIVFLVLCYLHRKQGHRWTIPRALWLWIIFLLITVYPAWRGGLWMMYDAASFYPSDILGALVMFWLGSIVVYDGASLRFFFSFFAIMAFVLALHTLFQSMTGVIIFGSAHVDNFLSQADVAYYQMAGTDTHRTGSFFIDPNWNGAFFAMVFFLPLGLFVTSFALWKKIGWAIVMGVILAALMLTYSTGAWAALLVGLAIFWVCGGDMRLRVLFPCCLLVVVVSIVVFAPSVVGLQLQHAAANDELSLRLAAWHTALNIVAAFPLTGVGLGHQAYLIQSAAYRVPEQFIPLSHPHDSYLELAAMAGLPVLFVFLTLLGRCLWFAWRNWLSAKASLRPLLGAGIAATMTLSANSISINGWTHFALAMMGWLILGSIAAPFVDAESDMKTFVG